METLHPTLWRMCRVLANEKRWRLLCKLFELGSETTGSLAEQGGMSPPVASLYLHALESQGLLTSEKRGKFVVYSPKADREIPHAGSVLEALRKCYGDGVPFETVSKAATAFTHPRRIAIVKALGPGALEESELSAKAQVPPQALRRHLCKLEKRNVLVSEGRMVRLVEPQDELLKALVSAALLSVGEL